MVYLQFSYETVENNVGKEEKRVICIFPFSHNISKRLVSQDPLKAALCSKGLTHSLPDDKILDCSKLKEIADDILEYI